MQRSFWLGVRRPTSSRSLGGSAIPRPHRVRRWQLTARACRPKGVTDGPESTYSGRFPVEQVRLRERLQSLPAASLLVITSFIKLKL